MSDRLQQKIPNNVNLAERPHAAARARALAAELPRLVARHGPERLRTTATSTCAPRSASTPQGWAHFGYVKMPDYRWGIFLADADAGPQDRLRRRTRASRRGRTCRANTARTCAASSSRRATPSPRRSSSSGMLGHTVPVALRPAQSVPGQRRGRPAPVGDGVPAARVLRPRRPRRSRGAARAPLRRRRQAAHPRRVQRADQRRPRPRLWQRRQRSSASAPSASSLITGATHAPTHGGKALTGAGADEGFDGTHGAAQGPAAGNGKAPAGPGGSGAPSAGSAARSRNVGARRCSGDDQHLADGGRPEGGHAKAAAPKVTPKKPKARNPKAAPKPKPAPPAKPKPTPPGQARPRRRSARATRTGRDPRRGNPRAPVTRR